MRKHFVFCQEKHQLSAAHFHVDRCVVCDPPPKIFTSEYSILFPVLNIFQLHPSSKKKKKRVKSSPSWDFLADWQENTAQKVFVQFRAHDLIWSL